MQNVETLNEQLLKGVQPQPLLRHFLTLCNIPRGSYNESAVAKMLLGLAEENGHMAMLFPDNNVLVTLLATPGMEDRPVICIQSHTDMVLDAKDKESIGDSMFPIKLALENGILSAPDTTLGADNGIGVAAMMALMTEKDIPHGKLELLFTSTEEDGMIGAKSFDCNLLEAKIVLNLDSEDWGTFFVGCAGGVGTTGTLTPQYVARPEGITAFTIYVEGLNGGHSGLKIHEEGGNAIQILGMLLAKLVQFDIALCSIKGGGIQPTSIPQVAEAEILVPNGQLARFSSAFNTAIEEFFDLHRKKDKGIQITYCQSEPASQVMNKPSMMALVGFLCTVPNGVIERESHDVSLIKTSSNVGIIKTHPNGSVTIDVVTRSSSAESLELARLNIVRHFDAQGMASKTGIQFEIWEPVFDSPLMQTAANVFEDMFHIAPTIATIHAGLEAGEFARNIPGVQVISFGPDIKGAHNPGEYTVLQTVVSFYDYLLKLIRTV